MIASAPNPGTGVYSTTTVPPALRTWRSIALTSSTPT